MRCKKITIVTPENSFEEMSKVVKLMSNRQCRVECKTSDKIKHSTMIFVDGKLKDMYYHVPPKAVVFGQKNLRS